MAIIIDNKKAKFNFDIEKDFEAGIALKGWEVKSIKSQKINLKNSYIKEKDGELYLVNAEVGNWKYGTAKDKKEQTRDRKLLLKRNQIRNILAILGQPGYSVVPLQIYTNIRGLIKLKIGIGKGQKKYDKRNKIKERDLKRRTEQDRKNYNI